MSFAQSVGRVIRRYGQPVTLFSPQGETVGQGYAFVQPIPAESKEYFWRDLSPLGSGDASLFRFLGEGDLLEEKDAASYLHTPDHWYDLRALQPVYLGLERCYWAGTLTCRPDEEECQ